MKCTFLPAPSLFYIFLIASSYPSLSFCFEILENLKLTKDGTCKAWAQAAPVPGLSANGIQSMGCFAVIPAKNLSSSLNGSCFLPENDKQPSSVPRRGVSPRCFLSCASCSWEGHKFVESVTSPFSSAPGHHSSSWTEGQARRKTEPLLP